MLALRRLLVVLCVVLSGVAYALTPGERVVLFSAIKPVWTANFLSPALVASQILPAGLTYTKSGSIPATQYDSTGKLTYGPNNLILYSSNFSNAAWVTNSATVAGSGPTTPAGNTSYSITATATSFAYIYQNLSGVPISGNKYLVSRVVKAGTASIVTLGLQSQADVYFDLTNLTTNIVGSGAANATVTDIGNGWRRISAVWTYGGASPARVYMSMASTLSNQGGLTVGWYYYTAEATYSAVTYETTPRTQDQVITTSAAYYGPRFDYDPSTLAPRGLLVEEARTNYALQSNTFSNATWANSVTTITPNAVTSPDGTTNAAKFVWQNGQATAYIYQTGLPNAAGTWTFSVYAKAAGFAGLRLDVYNPTDGEIHTNFDVSAGTITFGTGAITSVGNGWYRCSITYTTTTGTSTQAQIRNVQTGDGTNGIYVYGAQFEAGSFPTSYIPTAASTVQRTADVITFSGVPLAALKGSQVGVGVELTPYAINSGTSRGVIVSDAAPEPIYKATSTSLVRTYGGVSFADATPGDSATWANGGIIRAVASWNKTSIASIAANGGTVASVAAGFGSMTSLYLGSADGTNTINGWVRSVATYNQLLPPPTLKARSVVGAPY